MKPDQLASHPPGCEIVLVQVVTPDDYALVAANSPWGGVFKVGETRRPSNWPVLRPANDYGKLPWDIALPDGEEPDGPWEGGGEEPPAMRIAEEGSRYVSTITGDILGGPGPAALRLHIRPVKRRRMVVEVELDPKSNIPGIGAEARMVDSVPSFSFGAVTAVREVER